MLRCQVVGGHPNTYDSSVNSWIEIAVKTVSGLLRTNKVDLETRIGEVIPQAQRLFCWLAGYCAWIHNVRTRGTDGLTAYHGVRFRDFLKRLVPFGELVLVHMHANGSERKI